MKVKSLARLKVFADDAMEAPAKPMSAAPMQDHSHADVLAAIKDLRDQQPRVIEIKTRVIEQTKWKFTIKRDEDGFMSEIIATPDSVAGQKVQ